eukprot:6445411-Prymnesium_polylepis.1
MLSNQHTLLIDGNRVTFDVNEFNHAPSPFGSVAAFEEARQGYLEHTVTAGQLVEDAITGKELNIETQLLLIDFDSNSAASGLQLAEWQG